MATSDIGIIVKAEDKASKELKKVEGSLGKLGSAVGVAGKAIAGFAVAGAAAAGAFAVASIQQYSEVGDAVEKMSKRTGLGAQAVSALRVAADMGGTSIEAVEAAIKKMQISVDSLAKTSPDLVYQLEAIGFSLKDVQMMAPEKQFETLGNAIAMVEDPAQRTQMAIAAFGKAGTELIPMFEDGNFSMEAYAEQAKKLGVSFDDLSASKAAALNDALGKMQTAFNGVMLKVGGELAPIITDLIENRLAPLAEKFIEMMPTTDQVKTGFGNLFTSFKTAADEFDKKTGIVTQLREGFDKLWSKVEKELVPALEKLWIAGQPLIPFFLKVGEVLGAVVIVALKVMIELLIQAISLIITLITKAAEWAAAFYEFVTPVIDAVTFGLGKLGDAIGFIIKKYDEMKAAALAALAAAKSAVSSIPVVGGLITGSAPGRAVGGPVTAGMPYIVGERGPELFMPGQSGSIIPNLPGAGGGAAVGGVTINIGTFFGGNPEVAAREIGDLVIKRLQMNARVG